MSWDIPRIYPITDKALAQKPSHLSILRELVRGGAQIVQIRDKFTPVGQLLDDLYRCAEYAASKGIDLIVNDRCDLALSCGAAGVHLGQHDLPPMAARALLGPKKIIGLSAHSLSQVRRSHGLPIQYIGFGPIYSTSTKKDAHSPLGLKRLAEAAEISSLPIVAIGGIGLGQVRDVFQAGARSVAVISALMTAPDIAREMEKFLRKAMEK